MEKIKETFIDSSGGIRKLSALLFQFKQVLKGKRLLQNAIYSSGSFLLIAVINFATLPFFVKKLGVEHYGIYILVTSLLGYYGILDLGIGQGLIKFVSARANPGKKAEVISGIRSAFWVQFFIGLIASSLLYFNSTGISMLLNVGAQNVAETSQIIKLASIGFLFSSVSAIFSTSLMGLQLYNITSKVDAINNAAINVGSLAILYLVPNSGLYQLVFITVLSSLIIAVFYYFTLQKKITGLTLKFELHLPLLIQFFKFSIHIFFSKIANLFAGYVVKFIISIYVGPAAVTYFTVPSKLVSAFGGIMSSAANTLMPYISVLQSELRYEKIKSTLLSVSFIFSAMALPIALFISVFAKPILSVWMGREFADHSWLILTLTCISSTIGSFSTIPNQVVIGTGNSKLLGYFSILTVIAYCLFLPIFTRFYQLTGASLGLLVTSVILISVVIRKITLHLEISTRKYIRDVFSVHLLPIVFFVIIGLLILNTEHMADFTKLVIGLALMAIYYLCIAVSRKQFLVQLFHVEKIAVNTSSIPVN